MQLSLDSCIDKCNYSYDPGYRIPKNSVTWFHGDIADGFFTIEEGNLWTVFQGTSGFQDWKADFKAWKKTVPYGSSNKKLKVHSGIYNAYINPKVRDVIRTRVESFLKDYPNGNLIFTGHSLGGALAILCSLDIQYNYSELTKDKIYCVSLSNPSLGNKNFVDSFECRVKNNVRIKVGHDLVSRQFPEIIGYRHTKNLIWMKKRNILQILWNKLTSPFKMLFHWRLPVYEKYLHGNSYGSDYYSFDDHSLWNYDLGIKLF